MNAKIILLLIVVSIFYVVKPTSAQSQTDSLPPGVIIDHIPKSKGAYIGSPSICILPNGNYMASHDEFGPMSNMNKSPKTKIFISIDKGGHWDLVDTIIGQFWSNLFFYNDALYIMGTDKQHGNVIIRKSVDEGKTWSVPSNSGNGLLLKGEYHTAPVPIVIHKGKIWRAVEYATAETKKWGERYSAAMLSTPINSDLLNAKNWTLSNHLPYNKNYLNGNFDAWLEGNALATKNGKIVNILRVHTSKLSDEYCAIVNVESNGKKIKFNPDNFYKMPGATKKFTIRYDKKSNLYWSIVNYVGRPYEGIKNERIRNCLTLISSKNLQKWNIRKNILEHPDVKSHGFQYADWVFDGEDIVFVSRTAYNDEEGGAHNNHDANYLTFHRVSKFRDSKNNL